MLLPVTLAAAAAAGILTIWLMFRIGAIRRAEEISVGDGGNEALIRRMRAQMNFVETTPFALFLIAVIEIAGKGGNWLAFVAGIFMLGRVAHAFGMDGKFGQGRFIGTIVTLLTLLGLAIVAALVAMGVM